MASCFRRAFPPDGVLRGLGRAVFVALAAFLAHATLCLAVKVIFVHGISESEFTIFILISFTPFPLPFGTGVFIL